MPSPDQNEDEDRHDAGPRHFVTTHWTAVFDAAGDDSAQAHEALVELCRNYRYPLYDFIVRQGHSTHDAEDLTQEFFSKLIEKGFLTSVKRERGKFRSFLLMALKRFLSNERDRAHAQKRGGGQVIISLDAEPDESGHRLEPAHHQSPDLIYERRWAISLLNQVLARLAAEYATPERAGLFEGLRSSLLKEEDSLPYAEIAARLKLSPDVVKMAVHRMRSRYREILRDEIGKTVASPADIEDEIRHLFATFNN